MIIRTGSKNNEKQDQIIETVTDHRCLPAGAHTTKPVSQYRMQSCRKDQLSSNSN